ncbi:MAG: RSP_2648 family PIN domain-containing protein [Pseudomonadota bacterium]
MKALLDACVLFPTVLREILVGVAEQGLFTPLWSPRLLEEWARAARRFGPEDEAIARADAAVLDARFPAASVMPEAGLLRRLHLPDEDDIHVLAAAVTAGADVIVTFNAADFPRAALAAEGIARRDPDAFLRALWADHPGPVAAAVETVRARAERLSGQTHPRRALLRRARLPRLGRALDPRGGDGRG